ELRRRSAGEELSGPARVAGVAPAWPPQNATVLPPSVGAATHPLHRFHTWRRRLPRIPANRASRRLPTRCAACILWSAGHEDAACCAGRRAGGGVSRSEEHTSELHSRGHLICRLLLEKKNKHTM